MCVLETGVCTMVRRAGIACCVVSLAAGWLSAGDGGTEVLIGYEV